MITDEMLSQAAAELARAINKSLPTPSECHHEFSAAFERKMKRLMRKTNHPILHRTLRAIACFVLVVILGFGSVLTVSAEAREIVFGWIKQQYESFFEYFFEGESAENGSPQYRPGWLPSDFVFIDSFEIENGESYVYSSQDGTIAQFSYSSAPNSLTMYVEGVNCEKQDVSINGLPGELYIAQTSIEPSVLIWFDQTGEIIFNVSACLSKNDLIMIAENICTKKIFYK